RVTFGVCHIQTVAQIMMQYLRSAPDPENRSVINRALTGRYERGDQWEMILISAAPSRRSVRISPVNGQVIDHFAGLKLLGPSQKPDAQSSAKADDSLAATPHRGRSLRHGVQVGFHGGSSRFRGPSSLVLAPE